MSDERYERHKALTRQAADDLETFTAALKLSGFAVRRHHELVNGYHGWSMDTHAPWYLFETDLGLIRIGLRKRVIHVDWESTGLKWARPTDPDVTATDTFFHAWTKLKLVEYLQLLAQELRMQQGGSP